MYEFSPTEEKVAVVKEETNELVVMNLDGSETVPLVKDYGPNYFVWSPDGRYLAYGSEEERDSVLRSPEELYVLDVTSGQIRRITHKDDRISVDVRSWSPDGKWIAFDKALQLCVIHVEDGEEKCFDARAPGVLGFPVPWSPDSSMVAVSERIPSQGPSARWDIYSIRVADGKMTRLTQDSSSANYLLWRP